MMQWHHSFLGLGPGHSRRRGRQLKRAQLGAGGKCPLDTPGIGFTSVLFRAAVSWRHIWVLGGCAAAPWSCGLPSRMRVAKSAIRRQPKKFLNFTTDLGIFPWTFNPASDGANDDAR